MYEDDEVFTFGAIENKDDDQNIHDSSDNDDISYPKITSFKCKGKSYDKSVSQSSDSNIVSQVKNSDDLGVSHLTGSKKTTLFTKISKENTVRDFEATAKTSRITSTGATTDTTENEIQPDAELNSKSIGSRSITGYRNIILKAIENNTVCIINGRVGSGKSSQLIQYLYHAGWCKDKSIVLAQPNRWEAISLCERVARDIRCITGREVGYSVCFDDCLSDTTRIKFVTDKLLVREAVIDPFFEQYSVIILDDVHQRTIYTDILLSFLKRILKHRPDLRLIICCSIPSESNSIAQYFSQPCRDFKPIESIYTERHINTNISAQSTEYTSWNAKVINIDSKLYNVDIEYEDVSKNQDYVEIAAQNVVEFNATLPPGDILVILTSRKEVEKAIDLIYEQLTRQKCSTALRLIGLYGLRLTVEQLMSVYENLPSTVRRAFIVTSNLEINVYFSKVAYVIDCGYEKLKVNQVKTRIDGLFKFYISKSTARQRSMIAGQYKSGKCKRLYAQSVYENMAEKTTPQIQRCNLTSLAIYLRGLGIRDYDVFSMISQPNQRLLQNATELLKAIGIFNDAALFTKPQGFWAMELPINVMLARAVLEASSLDCLHELIVIAAITTAVSINNGDEGGSVWLAHVFDKEASAYRRKQWKTGSRRGEFHDSLMKFSVDQGDHITLFNVFRAFMQEGNTSAKWAHDHDLNYKTLKLAVNVYVHLIVYMKKFNIQVPPPCQLERNKSTGQSNQLPRIINENIRRCLTVGFFTNAAHRQSDGTYKCPSNRISLHAHPTSILFVSLFI